MNSQINNFIHPLLFLAQFDNKPPRVDRVPF